MYLQCNMVLILIEKQILEIVFDFIDEKDGRTNFAFAIADGTFFLNLDFCLRPYPLSGDLNKPEFRRWQYGVFGTVTRHLFGQFVEQLLTMFRIMHVDEIDDDNASHVAQT